MSYGLTSDGFRRKPFERIVLDVEDGMRNVFGNDIDLSPESVFGQWRDSQVSGLNEIWEQAEAVYNARFPRRSSGVPLDHAVEFNGIERRGATSSKVDVGHKGSDGTVIPVGTKISVVDTGDQFQCAREITLGATGLDSVFVLVTAYVASGTESITINGIPYSVSTLTGMDVSYVASALVDELNSNQGVVTAKKLSGGRIKLIKNSAQFSIAVSSNLEVWNLSQYESVDTGPVLGTLDTLTVIDTPVAGLSDVSNFENATLGQEIESDAELRLRREKSLNAVGTSTVDAIKARLEDEVDDVIDALVVENDEDVTVEGRPPHSLEIIVTGGDVAAIAEKIWETKPGGIQLCSTNPSSGPFHVETTIIDSEGRTQAIVFSRPVNKYAWIQVDLTLYTEEEFPGDGATQIAEAIEEMGRSLGAGKDILVERFKVPVFGVSGVASAVVRVAITDDPGDSPSYGGSNISIGDAEVSVWDQSRITVQVV